MLNHSLPTLYEGALHPLLDGARIAGEGSRPDPLERLLDIGRNYRV